ncbi:DNA repair protein RecN [bacterium]|nr:DNA repair protein RecN [Flavobacteriaceae bacterium]MDC0902732.1 DNA repair protein RecN [bacterium]
MLSDLSIKNYALIDTLQVQFDSGFTSITGETGAGKSILLGGLALVLGKRADLSNINDPNKKCCIEATFNIENFNLKSFFEEHDLDFETLTILRREILPSGKSRAFINDTPVNLTTLAELGGQLIDIHSQQQTQELTHDDFQFQIIDALAKNSTPLETYQHLLKSHKLAQKQHTELIASKIQSEKEQDYQTFLLNELTEANLKAIDLEALENEYNTLNNVESIQTELALAIQIISTEDLGVASNLRTLKQVFQKLSEIASVYAPLSERIQSIAIELDDVFNEIESEQSKLEVNPTRLNEIDAILQTVHNLFSKHAVNTIEALIEIEADLTTQLDNLASLDDAIATLENQLKSLVKQLDTQAKALHKQRQQVMPDLVQQLETILTDLGMPNARFKLVLNPSDSYLYNGKDQLEFLFTANKGGQFLPLKKAASGGELSRIMLAIKSVLSKYQQLPTIMFDEIDTGVSGEIAHKMGDIMSQMSADMQVFSITHLPQIAAKGQTHFKVYKQDTQNNTVTFLKKLTAQERVEELAQMLGGKKLSESAIAHANQLLN